MVPTALIPAGRVRLSGVLPQQEGSDPFLAYHLFVFRTIVTKYHGLGGFNHRYVLSELQSLTSDSKMLAGLVSSEARMGQILP